MTILALVTAIVAVSGVSMIPVWKPAAWAEDLGDQGFWIKLCSAALVIGIAASVAMAIMLPESTPTPYFFATVLASGLSATLLSIWVVTDGRLRLVDRRQTNLAILIGLPFSIWVMATHFDVVTLVVILSILFFSGMMYLYAQESIGVGDIRAMNFIAVVLTPLISYSGLMWAVMLVCSVFVGIGFFIAYITRKLRVSLPAAPMLLAPFVFILLTSPVITYTPLALFSGN